MRVWRDSTDSLVLHRPLAALSFVLDTKGDLSEIGRGHPKINKHKFYQPGAKFPADLSHLLPPSESRWWEHLGKSLVTVHLSLKRSLNLHSWRVWGWGSAPRNCSTKSYAAAAAITTFATTTFASSSAPAKGDAHYGPTSIFTSTSTS